MSGLNYEELKALVPRRELFRFLNRKPLADYTAEALFGDEIPDYAKGPLATIITECWKHLYFGYSEGDESMRIYHTKDLIGNWCSSLGVFRISHRHTQFLSREEHPEMYKELERAHDVLNSGRWTNNRYDRFLYKKDGFLNYEATHDFISSSVARSIIDGAYKRGYTSNSNIGHVRSVLAEWGGRKVTQKDIRVFADFIETIPKREFFERIFPYCISCLERIEAGGRMDSARKVRLPKKYLMSSFLSTHVLIDNMQELEKFAGPFYPEYLKRFTTFDLTFNPMVLKKDLDLLGDEDCPINSVSSRRMAGGRRALWEKPIRIFDSLGQTTITGSVAFLEYVRDKYNAEVD